MSRLHTTHRAGVGLRLGCRDKIGSYVKHFGMNNSMIHECVDNGAAVIKYNASMEDDWQPLHSICVGYIYVYTIDCI